MESLPRNFHLQYSKEAIGAQVERLGEDIGQWADKIWQDTGKDILAIPVLRGGIFFFADLVRQIKTSVAISPAQSWAYTPEENGVMLEKVGVKIDQEHARGRSILLVDDICDSGETLKALTASFLAAGAVEVRAAVLIRRKLEKQSFDPHWSGFEYAGPEWFVGYGMEDRERWRNLPAIYTISQTEQN